MAIIKSSPITFLDYTDSRKLEVYISSNLPNTQIYNPNNKTYSPDWQTTNLVLSSTVFLDSTDITNDSKVSFQWYKQINTSKTSLNRTSKSLTRTTNEMSGSTTIITYICRVLYDNNLTAEARIVFTRSDTGIDGQSITIKGTATSVSQVSDTDNYTITYNGALVSDARIGDAYVYNGDLYMCSEVIDGIDYFVNVGNIQGPKGDKGDPGDDAKSISLTSSSQIFKVDQEGNVSPSIITVQGQVTNTTVSIWSYSVDGITFTSTAPPGVSRDGNTVTIDGNKISSNTIVIKTSDGIYSDSYTIYKVYDGVDGEPGSNGQSASMAFLTNENVTFSADAQGQIASTNITSNIVAYNGITKALPVVGTITNIPDGMTITSSTNETTKEVILTIDITDNATLGSAQSNNGTISIPITSPVNTYLYLNWSKVNTGVPGTNGADAVVFQIYSENGYVLSKDVPSITLKTFAYNGDVPIEAGANYQWYQIIDGAQNSIPSYVLATVYNSNEKYYSDSLGTVANPQPTTQDEISNGTYYIYSASSNMSYLEISHTDVSFSCSYMCKMEFNGVEYVSVVTVDDKNDTNMIFTSKPSSYMAGDIWVVGEDYQPGDIEVGTVLRAEHTNDTYADSDWVTATKYDEQLQSLQEDIDQYNQYFSFDLQNGLRVSARDADGNQSKFSTTLSNTQLAFNEGDEAIAYISGNKMHIKEAEVESPLTVTGKYSGETMLQAPIINLGNFSLVVENNGSLSIVSNL